MANALLAYRERKKLSQQEVADSLGISRQMVSFLENDEREFTINMVLLIEEKLGINRLMLRPDYFRKRAA